ncbi:MAG: branched-chain amino acid ABC transporter permease [Desulfobacteraceae bacterium]|nr:branched-chain amino acid ABC transporter permease [Desulfobacteraceae bacterium]
MINTGQIIIILLNGVTTGMLLFLLASGLILILGVMGIVNMSHGAFFLLSGYISIAIASATDNFLIAVLGGTAAIVILGILVERFLLRRVPGGVDAQVLLTFAFVYIIADFSRGVWGGYPQGLHAPAILAGSVKIPGAFMTFPIYRLSIVVFGLIIAVALWLFLEKTRFGAIIRAGVDDREMVMGIGINIKMLFTAVFALGSLLVGLAGALGAPIMPVYPGQDWNILLLGMIVLVVGGASIRGALLGSLIIGLADNIGKFMLPQLAMFLLFGIMALILALKPQGLFR